MMYKKIVAMIFAVSLFGIISANAAENSMSFFVTSAGSGKGGDLGGLTGADAHCQALAVFVFPSFI